MCAISGSFDKESIKELYKLNSYRGELSYSVATFSPHNNKTDLMILMQDSGKLPETLIDNLDVKENHYIVCHSQAPTTDSDNIHPAVYGNALLWHNGIIKQKSMKPGTWDTAWLLDNIVNYGWSALSRVDGTFACVMFWGESLYVFRNEISPLFIDKYLNISSTKKEGYESIAPNIVHKMNLEGMYLTSEAYFSTFENPYYIPGG